MVDSAIGGLHFDAVAIEQCDDSVDPIEAREGAPRRQLGDAYAPIESLELSIEWDANDLASEARAVFPSRDWEGLEVKVFNHRQNGTTWCVQGRECRRAQVQTAASGRGLT